MAGPWEKYQSAGPPSGAKDPARAPLGGGQRGPWEKYAAPQEDRVDQGFAVAGSAPQRPELRAAVERAAMAQPTGGARSAGGGFMESLDAGLRGAADAGSFGFADEISAGLGTGFGFLGDYDEELKRQRAIDAYDAQNHVGSRIVGQLGGGIASAGGLMKQGLTLAPRAAQAGLAGRAGLGAVEGAAYGAGYGFGSGEDGVVDRTRGAAEGAAIGGAAGGILPVVTAGIRAAGKPVVDAIGARVNPEGYAAQKVAERVGSDRGIPEATNRITRAAQGGDAMSLADVSGENARSLARTVTNVPGAGRAAVKAKVTLSAMGQGDRLKGLVSEAFGNPEGAYQAAKATVMDARSSAAKPYYDAAYQRPIPYTFNIEDLLNTPAGKAGLAAAKKNSANRREPWAQWFASIDDNGNIIDKRRVPDTRALDEVQREIGGLVEGAKRAADGSPFAKAKDTPASIAIRSVHQDLLKEMDAANPAFAKARAVGLDNIQADEALEFGRNALNTDARINARKMGVASAYGRDTVLNEGQRELARFGLAEALREKIDKAGMTHNAILKFFSTREQIARIRPFFKTDADWKAFRASIINEARKRATYNAVSGNSTTARQLADMNEANGLGGMVDIGSKIATGSVGSAALSAIQQGLRRLGGLTPQVADHIGRMLLTRDPGEVQRILTRVREIEAAKITSDRKAVAIRQLLVNFASGAAGRAVGQPSNALEAPQYRALPAQ